MDLDEYKEEKEISWSEADIRATNFVKIDRDKEKKLFLQNWKLVEKKDKFTNENKVFFIADVLNEDDVQVVKILETPSARFRSALRKILENADKSVGQSVAVTKVGEGVDTQYSVKAL